MNKLLIGIVISVIVLVLLKKPVQKITKMTRGYRNNNHGNIVKTYNSKKEQTFWQGEIEGKDSRFKTFKSPEYGYRAIFIVLRSYIGKGVNTIEKIINRYAPPFENQTSSYVGHVVEETGIDKDETISMIDNISLLKIVASISRIENGIKPDKQQIEDGYKLFLG